MKPAASYQLFNNATVKQGAVTVCLLHLAHLCNSSCPLSKMCYQCRQRWLPPLQVDLTAKKKQLKLISFIIRFSLKRVIRIHLKEEKGIRGKSVRGT